MVSRLKRSWRPAIAAVLCLVFAGIAQRAAASSHSEAPLIAQDPTVDNCDVYFFVDPNHSDKAVLIATFNGLGNPASGPNFKQFADGAWYDFHIDNDGDGVEDVTYRFIFQSQVRNGETFLYNTGAIASNSDPNRNVIQTYMIEKIIGPSQNPDPSNVTVIGGGDTSNPFYVAPWRVGPKSYPNGYFGVNGSIYNTSDGSIAVCAPRADPFFVDLGMIFDLINLDHPGRANIGLGNVGGGKNTLYGFNVMAIAMEVPISNLTKGHDRPTDSTTADAIVGLWSTTSRKATRVFNTNGTITDSGDYVQVSRLGNPLINEVAIPLESKDLWNATQPKDDLTNFGKYALDPILAKYFTALFGISVPAAPRNDVVEALFTGVPGLNMRPNETVADEVRLNVAVPAVPIAQANSLGVLAGDLAGFPNGRRVCDDVVDIELRVVAGVLVSGFNVAPNNELGDGVDAPDPSCRGDFPFMVLPWDGFHDLHAGPVKDTHAPR